MAQTVNIIILSGEDRKRLEAIAADRSRPLKHIQRTNIVLCSAKRLPVLEVARRAGISRRAVWRWQRRYAEEGVDGLLRDKTRKPGRAPLSQKIVAKVLELTCSQPPAAATHWTGRAMAKVMGISLRAVQRLWEKHRLQPHRIRTFKHSSDPKFAEKVEDVVGLHMNPPAHAVVVSIDEKSQIQIQIQASRERRRAGVTAFVGNLSRPCPLLRHHLFRDGHCGPAWHRGGPRIW